MDDRRREMLRAYSDASAELRKTYDDEFHAILERLYEERGISVRKRRSHKQAQRAKILAALELVRTHNIS